MAKFYVSCKDVGIYIIIARDDAAKAARDAIERYKLLHPDVNVNKGVVTVSEKGMLKADSGTFSISQLLKDDGLGV